MTQTEYQIPTPEDIQGFSQSVSEDAYERIVQYLQKFGPNIVNKPFNDFGWSALDCAAMASEKTFATLIEFGADVNKRRDDGRTAMMRVAPFGCIGVIDILLAGGANIDAQCDEGKTALMYAVYCPQMVEALLQRGADVFLRNVKGETALDLATTQSETDLAPPNPQSQALISDVMDQKAIEAKTFARQQALKKIPKFHLKKKM